MAGVVGTLGWGGQSYAEKHLGWNRGTIRKGLKEQRDGAQKDCFYNEQKKTKN